MTTLLAPASRCAEAASRIGRSDEPDDRFRRERLALDEQLAERLAGDLPGLYAAMAVPGPYAPDARSAGARALRNACLGLISRRDGGDRAAAQFAGAGNMTDSLAALACLLDAGRGDIVATLLWDGRFSLMTAVLAGFGRAIAEVGAVIIVGGNIDHLTRVMTTAIALETSKGDLALALALGIVLVTISLSVNAAVMMLRLTTTRYAYA